MAKKAKPTGPGYDDDGNYDPDRDYDAKSDADTLTKAEEIKNDANRHEKAAYHLGKRADAAKSAHASSRKHLERHVKKGLKKAFNGGGTFQDEKDKEVAEQSKTLGEYQ